MREFVEHAFLAAGDRIQWKGEGASTIGRDSAGRVRVTVDPQLFRPAEVEVLLGDASKARERIGWKPEMSFEDLVAQMVDADIRAVRGEIPS